MKKVSVVMPVYNMEEVLAQSIHGLLDQTYENIELILVDDGSSDRTLKICESFAKLDARVKVIRSEKNRGAGAARNLGIREATGDYVYFPDADDRVEPDAIKTLMEVVEDFACDLVVFGYRIIDSKGRLKTKIYPNSFLTGEAIRSRYEAHLGMMRTYSIQGAAWNKLFNLKIIKTHQIEYPILRRHQDEVFISRYVNYIQNACFIPDILYTYFANDLVKMWDKYPDNYLDIAMALRQHQMETILRWNPQNGVVLDIIEKEYIRRVIKAMELSFSTKLQLATEGRKKWIKEAVDRSELDRIELKKRPSKIYQRAVLSRIHRRRYDSLYYLLSLKMFINKRFGN